MNDAEKLIEILTIIAIVLVMIICGLVAIYFFVRYNISCFVQAKFSAWEAAPCKKVSITGKS